MRLFVEKNINSLTSNTIAMAQELNQLTIQSVKQRHDAEMKELKSFDPTQNPHVINTLKYNREMTSRYHDSGPELPWGEEGANYTDEINAIIKKCKQAALSGENSIRIYEDDTIKLTRMLVNELKNKGFKISDRLDIWHDESPCVENSYHIIGW